MMMEYKHLKFEMKAFDNEEGIFEGYAAYKGNIDSYGDIIETGAFKRTLRGRKNFPIFFNHDPNKPVGMSVDIKEDEKGLFTKGKIDTNTELGRMVMSGLKQGYLSSMSIGYKVIQDAVNKRGNRLLKEIKLLEYSILPTGFGANELATVTNVKSDIENRQIDVLIERIDDLEEEFKSLKEQLADPPLGTLPPQDPSYDTLEIKAVIGSSDLPLAPRDHSWYGPEAKKRIFEWAGGTDFDPGKAKKAFFFVGGDDENRGSYKLPFADIINGSPHVVYKALSAVEGALNGARGGVDGIGESEKSTIMGKVNSYKKKFGDNQKFDDEMIGILKNLRKNLRGDK